MANTYEIIHYVNFMEDGIISRNKRRIGKATRPYKRAIKIVYWLRRRGVMAFAS